MHFEALMEQVDIYDRIALLPELKGKHARVMGMSNVCEPIFNSPEEIAAESSPQSLTLG